MTGNDNDWKPEQSIMSGVTNDNGFVDDLIHVEDCSLFRDIG